VALSDELEAAVAAVRRGEVIGLPTDTVYGVGADPFRPDAARRVFAAKGRPEAVALPVLVADPGTAAELAVLDGPARILAARFWPGPLTVVLRRRPGVELHLGGDPTTVGLRCPDHEVARAVLARTGPLAVTSANRHGEPPATTAGEVRRQLGSGVAVVIDAGRCDGSPSTVVSLLAGEGADGPGRRPAGAVRILRQGSISETDLLSCLEARP
jgi:L-threonylcarbamoyladenylate synthase